MDNLCTDYLSALHLYHRHMENPNFGGECLAHTPLSAYSPKQRFVCLTEKRHGSNHSERSGLLPTSTGLFRMISSHSLSDAMRRGASETGMRLLRAASAAPCSLRSMNAAFARSIASLTFCHFCFKNRRRLSAETLTYDKINKPRTATHGARFRANIICMKSHRIRHCTDEMIQRHKSPIHFFPYFCLKFFAVNAVISDILRRMAYLDPFSAIVEYN